jgi:hypothetical protein
MTKASAAGGEMPASLDLDAGEERLRSCANLCEACGTIHNNLTGDGLCRRCAEAEDPRVLRGGRQGAAEDRNGCAAPRNTRG